MCVRWNSSLKTHCATLPCSPSNSTIMIEVQIVHKTRYTTNYYGPQHNIKLITDKHCSGICSSHCIKKRHQSCNMSSAFLRNGTTNITHRGLCSFKLWLEMLRKNHCSYISFSQIQLIRQNIHGWIWDGIGWCMTIRPKICSAEETK